MIKEILDFELDENEEKIENATNNVSNKYKDRKLDHRLTKYEAIIKKVEKIDRIEGDSEYLFVGNCGLENNVSYEFLNETFSEFGKVIDIIMQKRKSYAFIIYENKESPRLAIESLQSKVIACNQTPICFYIFPVNKVPDISLDNDYKPVDKLPNGLVYLENFIDETYASELVEFLEKHDNLSKDLKKRRVKHFGYEFRYGTNDCDENKPLIGNDQQIPLICNRLIGKMLSENLIKSAPDQMTVNFYEPGHGIPPHM